MPELKKRPRRWLPTAQALEQTRGFAWLGDYLRERRRLWVLPSRKRRRHTGAGQEHG